MTERPKIEWLSPLPPCRSGIADYTNDVAEALSAVADVRYWNFFGDDGRGLSPRFLVADWNKVEGRRALECAGIPIYHFGNNPQFHRPMWHLIRRWPGVAVIHDQVLLGLAADAFARRSTPEGFTRTMQRYYGAEGIAASRDILQGTADLIELGPRFPFTPYVLKRATAAVVHTRALRDFVATRFDMPLLYAPLPYRGGGSSSHRGGFRNPLQIVVFGHLGPNRRLPSILAAISESPYRDRLHLTVAGEIAGRAEIAGRIERLQLDGHVTILGFVTEQRLAQLLAGSDVAINLRFPTMGEASHSQLHLWAAGLPTLATNTGWYAEQPETTLVRIEPAREIEGIKEFIALAFEQPQLLLEVGRKGREWVERVHSPMLYAKNLVEFLGSIAGPPWRRARPRSMLGRIRSLFGSRRRRDQAHPPG
jgi:glycosyltransferase involved in cell wall biosynthesis